MLVNEYPPGGDEMVYFGLGVWDTVYEGLQNNQSQEHVHVHEEHVHEEHVHEKLMEVVPHSAFRGDFGHNS